MPTIQLPNGWKPRGYQLPLWRYLEGGGKRAVAAWHRRAGKDDLCLHWTACAAMQRPGTYWHLLPSYTQARKAIWEAVNPHTGKRRIDEAFPKAIREATRDQEMFIKLKGGSTWQMVGSDTYNALVGSPPVGVVFSEYALANPNAWAFLRPILAENGGWALFISTPRGRNHFGRMYDMARRGEQGWYGQLLTVEQTQAIPMAVIEQERHELTAERGADEAEAIIQQEYYCSFDAAIPGAYYGKLIVNAEKEGRVRAVPYDPKLPVFTAWDLGIGDSTAIWFAQAVGSEVRLIDYYESSGVGFDHYAKVLREKPYIYSDHLVPHDAEVSELGTGTTRVETLRGLGIRARVVKKSTVADGINAVRLMLPRCYFDERACERGLDALRQYQREWDEDRKCFRERPLHDWTSHAADAFRYLAVGLPHAVTHLNQYAAPMRVENDWDATRG